MNNRQIIRYLIWIIFTLAILILVFSYFWINGGANWENAKNMYGSLIPEFLGTLIPIAVIYILFKYRGIDIQELINIDRPLWLKNGYSTHKEVNWDQLLGESEKLIIVAFYFENWIIKHDENFRNFIKKKNSIIKIYLPDYENEILMEELSNVIPKYDDKKLKDKIVSTISELKKRFAQENINLNKIEIRLYDKIFNYTLQGFDDVLLFSINELCREQDYNSPFIEINRSASKQINKFFEQEIQTLNKKSRQYQLVF